MSVECGECEMDLRNGHAPGCSRYRPEKEIVGYLVREELIHPADQPEVERLALRVLAEERARLRERVEVMRSTVNESLAKRFQAGKTASTVYWSEVGQEKALSEVLALLDEGGES